MIHRAWRIVKRKHQAEAFSGEGARLYGGRWNSSGIPMVYMAESQSLAALELLVHLESQDLLFQYAAFEVTFESTLVTELESPLPKGWDDEPVPRKIRLIGDKWVMEKASPILRVPSAIITSEHNYLLNPAHQLFKKVHVGTAAPFRVHQRLQKKLK